MAYYGNITSLKKKKKQIIYIIDSDAKRSTCSTYTYKVPPSIWFANLSVASFIYTYMTLKYVHIAVRHF